MKYIRTKDGRIAEIKENMIVKVCDDATRLVYKKEPYICVLNGNDDILKQADTIEKLCDVVVYVKDGYENNIETIKDFQKRNRKLFDKDLIVYGAIWTDKGLIYVAKMNENGELELL